MHRRARRSLTRFAALGLAVAAIAGPATPCLADDAAFDAVRTRYARLVSVIESGGGLYEQDRPVVRAVLRDISGYLADQPQDARALAMDLQLSRWLDEDPDRIEATYARLTDLRPDDAGLALAALRWKSSESRLDADAADAAWASLSARFPQNPEIALEHARRLKNEVRYEDLISTVERIDVDPNAAPELYVLLAEGRYAQQDFEGALAALDAIGTFDSMQFRLRTRADELRDWIEDTRDRWPGEQELRAAEASADDLPRAAVETVRGTITVELFEDAAPNTVANFISLAESGFYAGTTFHRFIPDFMVQGGDSRSKEGVEGTPGTGNPGYLIPDEHGEGFEARAHFNDTLAMANTGAPNSGGSQFYFNHKPTPWLNDRHTVFGRVIDGQHIVRRLRANDRIIGVTILRKRDHAYVPETIAIEPPAAPAAPDPAPAEGDGEAAGDAAPPAAEGQTPPAGDGPAGG